MSRETCLGDRGASLPPYMFVRQMAMYVSVYTMPARARVDLLDAHWTVVEAFECTVYVV